MKFDSGDLIYDSPSKLSNANFNNFMSINFIDDEEDEKMTTRILRHIELIDDEASEYGIRIVKSSDDLMAKKFGYRSRPGITYFRKGWDNFILSSLKHPRIRNLSINVWKIYYANVITKPLPFTIKFPI